MADLQKQTAALESKLAEARRDLDTAEQEIESILESSGDVAALRKKLSEARAGRDILARRVAATEKELRGAEAQKKTIACAGIAKEREQREAELAEHVAEVEAALESWFGPEVGHNLRHPGNPVRYTDPRANDETRRTAREAALMEEVGKLRGIEESLAREIQELTA